MPRCGLGQSQFGVAPTSSMVMYPTAGPAAYTIQCPAVASVAS